MGPTKIYGLILSAGLREDVMVCFGHSHIYIYIFIYIYILYVCYEVLMPLLEKYFGSIPNQGGPPGQPAANLAVKRRSELEMRNAVTPVSIPFPTKSVREDTLNSNP